MFVSRSRTPLLAVLLLAFVCPQLRGQTLASARIELPRTSSKSLRVLFIGNSYTFFNGGMGTLVQQLAAGAKSPRKIEFTEVTKGGQNLEGHWKDGKALAAIRKGGWDYVVLQEHSLGPIDHRDRMFQYGRMFDAEVKKVGARTLFFETWARKNRPEMQPALNAAYEGLAREVGAAVAFAGPAWERVLRLKPQLALHNGDSTGHPSPAGSYLNACIFYSLMVGASPEGLPRTIRSASGKVLVDLAEADAALLQRVATETIAAKRLAAASATSPQS